MIFSLQSVQDNAHRPQLPQLPTWVDPQSGRVRSVHEAYPYAELPTGSASAQREQAALLPTMNTQDWTWEWPDWWLDVLDAVGSFFSGWGEREIYLLFLGLILIFLLIVFILLARTKWGPLARQTRDAQRRRRRAVAQEELPFEWEAGALTVEGLWQQALQAKEAGDFRLALMFLYSYLLIELDAQQLLRLQRGKTNRDYSRELGRSATVYDCFQATMLAFEQVFFGRYQLTRPQVDELFAQVARWGQP
jgi:hypothetical protein